MLELHTLKPLDRDLVLETVSASGAAVTCEKHSVIGGLGSAVAELLPGELPAPVQRVGIRDTYVETGPYAELLDRYGLGVADIVSAAREVLRRKEGRGRSPAASRA